MTRGRSCIISLFVCTTNNQAENQLLFGLTLKNEELFRGIALLRQAVPFRDRRGGQTYEDRKIYEIAAIPQQFQKGCHCSTAEYTFINDGGYVKVLNSCNKDSVNGPLSQIEGKAFVVKGSGNAKLKVQFFWPFRGDYWILELAEDYSWAAVGSPKRNYLWILSRTPEMDENLFKEITGRVAKKGFDIAKLQRTVQSAM